MKKLSLRYRFYQFTQRLEYNYKYVNESYTSKISSNCGNYDKYDKYIGNNTMYNCDACNLVIDRDVNGARNIYMKVYMHILRSSLFSFKKSLLKLPLFQFFYYICFNYVYIDI